VPKPGVPESFKVLVKELQSLGLDIRVLDKNMEEINLVIEDDDDSFEKILRDETYGGTSDQELASAGFGLEDENGDAIEPEVYDFDGFDNLDEAGYEIGNDDM
jgi:DNA-directed RNA polymerase subunit beta